MKYLDKNLITDGVVTFYPTRSNMKQLAARALLLLFPLFTLAQRAPATSPPQVQTQATSAGDIYKRSSQAVVVIDIYDDKGKVKGAGSGFLVGADGRILTNYHVI